MKSRFSRAELIKLLSQFRNLFNRAITKPYLVFMLLGTVFGIFYIFLIPAFFQPDEIAHFNRIYQISQGHLIDQKVPGAYGDYIPKPIIDFEGANYKYLIHTNAKPMSFSNTLHEITSNGTSINTTKSKSALEFVNTEQYSPVLYIPQVFAMLISKIVNLSIVDAFYLIRAIGFFAWLIICGYAIKKMKALGWAAAILLLTPASLSVAASVSADAMTIAYSALFLGLVYEAINSQRINRRQIILLIVSAILLASAKVPYEILLFTVLLIPSANFIKGRNDRLKFLAIMASILIVVTGSWLIISQSHYVSYRTLTTGIPINQKIQESYIINHPISFGHKIYDTYLRTNPYSYDPLWGLVGILTSIGFSIPNWAICLYFATLGSVFVKLRSGALKKDYLSKSKRGYATLLALFLFFAINAAIYVSWSRQKIQIIEGIQSRYFIPVCLLLVFIALPVYKKKIKLNNSFYYLFVISVMLIQIAAVASIYYQIYTAPMPVLT